MSSNEWRKYKLEEIAEIIGGGTPSTTNPDFWGEEIPWVTPRDLASTDERFISCGERNITKKGLQNSSARLLPAGTVLLTTRAPIGYLRIALNPICTNQGFKSLIPKADIADNQFLFYLLKNNVEYLKSVGVGTTFAEISGSALRQIEFQFPPLPTQRRIADILSALDDKIELNRQTNATLEAIAQAIFKEWFVDFNFPGATGEMVESEMGMIPKGWRAGKVEDFVKISTGKGLHKNEFIERGYPVLGANGLIGYTGNYLLDEEVILTGRVGTLGTFQLVNERVWISDNVLILQPIDKEKYYFSYFWLKTINFRNLNRGSTQPLVTKTDLSNQQLLIPDPITLLMFDMICRSLYNHFNNNKQQSFTLTTIRDTLLPRLINGEIPV